MREKALHVYCTAFVWRRHFGSLASPKLNWKIQPPWSVLLSNMKFVWQVQRKINVGRRSQTRFISFPYTTSGFVWQWTETKVFLFLCLSVLFHLLSLRRNTWETLQTKEWNEAEEGRSNLGQSHFFLSVSIMRRPTKKVSWANLGWSRHFGSAASSRIVYIKKKL